MAVYNDFKPKKYDDYFTKETEWEQIAPHIPKNKIVSMPFYSPYSKCNVLLGKYINNRIIYRNEDFFKNKGCSRSQGEPFPVMRREAL